MAVQIINGLVFIIAILTQCQPLRYYWDRSIPGGHCVSYQDGYLTSSIVNMIMDIMVIVLPVRVIWRLQMTRRRKIAISLVFGLGAL